MQFLRDPHALGEPLFKADAKLSRGLVKPQTVEAEDHEYACDYTDKGEPPPLPECRLAVGNGKSHYACGWQNRSGERRLEIAPHKKRRILGSGVSGAAPFRV